MLNIPVLIGVVLWMALMFVIGIIAGLRVKTSQDFFIGNRSFGLFPILATQAATAIGGGCMIGWCGFGFTYGFGVMFYSLSVVVGMVILVGTVARHFQSKGYYTVPDWLCASLGENKLMRGIASIIAMWVAIGWWAGNATALGTIVHQLTGLPIAVGALVGGGLALIYCAVGGLVSVVRTDQVQFIALWIGAFILIPFALKAAGGFPKVAMSVPKENLDIWPGMAVALGWLFAVGPGQMTLQMYYQRFSASKSAKVAVWGMIGTIIATIGIGIYASLVGLSIRTINPELASGQQAVPWFASTMLPPIIGIFILGGITAAIFSTADSSLHSAAANVARDFYGSIIKPTATEKDVLRVGRWTVVIIGIFGIIAALYIPSVMRWIVGGYVITAGGLLFPLFLGHYWKRTTRAGAIAGMLGGFVIALPSVVIPAFQKWVASLVIAPVIGALIVSLLLTVIVSLATKKEAVARA
jgi:SSS family solute:Na+ symporter